MCFEVPFIPISRTNKTNLWFEKSDSCFPVGKRVGSDPVVASGVLIMINLLI